MAKELLPDALWAQIAPLLGGILWVVRSGAAWRAMPEACGTWETASIRYRRWLATGPWPRILAALAC
jgi:transposase